MPFDPTEVRSRDELLMGAIATGDSTVIGDPRDRNEEFIKAIADGIGSAGGALYIHHIKQTHHIDEHTVFYIYYTAINNTPDVIQSIASMRDNINNIMSVNGQHAETGFATIFFRVALHSTSIRTFGTKIELNMSNQIEAVSETVTASASDDFTDTVTAL